MFQRHTVALKCQKRERANQMGHSFILDETLDFNTVCKQTGGWALTLWTDDKIHHFLFNWEIIDTLSLIFQWLRNGGNLATAPE